ncbi:MAG: hypothetical protein ACC612_06120 [Methanomethylovorans sp.]|uniref:hypothetical protein n=1 Tax=Methanomethylovorans sp. TaxID=2758717 RepID=UPI0035312224
MVQLINVVISASVLLSTLFVPFLISWLEKVVYGKLNNEREMWYSLLKSDRIVKECIDEVNDGIETVKLQKWRWVSTLGLFWGTFTGIIGSLIIMDKTIIFYDFICLLVAYSIIMAIISIIIMNKFNKMPHPLDKGQLLDDSKKWYRRATFIEVSLLWFYATTTSTLLNFPSSNYIDSLFSNMDIREIFSLFSIYFEGTRFLLLTFLFSAALITFVITVAIKWRVSRDIEEYLDFQYSNGFPNVQVKIEGSALKGKMKSIFNRNMLLLSDNGEDIGIMWTKLSNIRIMKHAP